MKNRILFLLMLVAVAFSSTSCLTSGLKELPAFDDNEILALTFCYRYMDENDKMSETLMKGTTNIDSAESTITCDIVVPEASSTLPAEQRETMSLKRLVGYCTISTAAIIEPVGTSPKLGGMNNWSVEPLRYKVTAADGTERVWTIVINSFTK